MNYYLSDHARKVMQLANQEAQRFNHEYIGTEHILLGLVKEGSGVAANVLKNLDIDLRKIRLEVEKIVQAGPDVVTMAQLPWTPRAKKVIEYAIEEARNLNHNYVGTEHLLLGLLRVQDGVAAQVLINLGLKLEDVHDEMRRLLGIDLPDRPSVAQRSTEKHGRSRGRARRIAEYEVFLPLRYNDGTLIEAEKIAVLKKQLTERFGNLSSSLQKHEDISKIGNVTFRGEVVVLRVLTTEIRTSREFFLRLKEELKADLKQEDILIIERKGRLL